MTYIYNICFQGGSIKGVCEIRRIADQVAVWYKKSKCEKKLSSWCLAKNKVLMIPPTEKKQAKLEEYGFTMASVRKNCPVDAWLRIKY